MRVELSIYISPTRGGKRHNSGQCENLWKCSKIRRLNISEMLKIEKIVPDYWLGTQKSVFTSGNLFYPVSNSILPEEGVPRRCLWREMNLEPTQAYLNPNPQNLDE